MTDLDALLAQADKHHVRPGDDECWECGSETWPCEYHGTPPGRSHPGDTR